MGLQRVYAILWRFRLAKPHLVGNDDAALLG
jgi:hypothetical protein